MRREGLQLPAGEVIGRLLELGELFQEFGVIEPAADGPLGNASVAGGLGDGMGEGEDGEYGLLAGGEPRLTLGNYDFAVRYGIRLCRLIGRYGSPWPTDRRFRLQGLSKVPFFVAGDMDSRFRGNDG